MLVYSCVAFITTSSPKAEAYRVIVKTVWTQRFKYLAYSLSDNIAATKISISSSLTARKTHEAPCPPISHLPTHTNTHTHTDGGALLKSVWLQLFSIFFIIIIFHFLLCSLSVKLEIIHENIDASKCLNNIICEPSDLKVKFIYLFR